LYGGSDEGLRIFPDRFVKILVLPGDGIGPEITAATLHVLEKLDGLFALGLVLEHDEIGFAALAKTGTTLPDAVLERAAKSDGIVLGPISHLDYPPRDQGGVNVSAAFRVKLDLYANVRPARTRPGIGRTHRATWADRWGRRHSAKRWRQP